MKLTMLVGAAALVGSATIAVPDGASAQTTPAPRTVSITGRGYGHGVGLSQYGAYGYAIDHGWTAAQILDHYYGGTVSATQAAPPITVQLTALDDRQTAVVAGPAGVAVFAADLTVPKRTWKVLVVREVAERKYRVWGRADVAQCPAETIDLTLPTSGWTELTTAVGVGPAVQIDPSLTAAAVTDPDALLGLCRPDGTVRVYRGSIRAANGTVGENRTVNEVPLESYLWSVVGAEVPTSWGDSAGRKGMEALRAQAVAARSYARAQNRSSYAKTCDTQTCQVYNGAGRRATPSAPFVALEYTNTTQAVNETAGVVRVFPSGAIASTMFSSSSGGQTAPGAFTPVVDLGDATVSNKRHRWTKDIPFATIEAAWPAIGALESIAVQKRDGFGEWGGRVLSMTVSGTKGQVVVTGNQFRVALGLFSNYFTVTSLCAGYDLPPITGTVVDSGATRYVPAKPSRLFATDIRGTRVALNRGCTAAIPLVLPTGAKAVVLNVTTRAATSAAAAFEIYPCGTRRPGVWAAHGPAGQSVTTQAIVPVSAAGICVYNPLSAAHVTLDVLGWLTTAATGRGVAPIRPVRAYDSRRSGSNLAAGSVTAVSLPRAPSASAYASLNVSVPEAAAAGFVTVYPCATTRPVVPTVTVKAGVPIANHTWVGRSSTGTVCVHTTVVARVVLDLDGWLTTGGAALRIAAPSRKVDTRTGKGGAIRLTGGQESVVTLTGSATPGAVAVTIVRPATAGFVSVYPCGTSPLTAAVTSAGGTAVNTVLVTTNAAGALCVKPSTAMDLTIDAVTVMP